jgi:hypothetical protein
MLRKCKERLVVKKSNVIPMLIILNDTVNETTNNHQMKVEIIKVRFINITLLYTLLSIII